jgi:hypothetical protein
MTACEETLDEYSRKRKVGDNDTAEGYLENWVD